MKRLFSILLSTIIFSVSYSQASKIEPNAEEIAFIQQTFNEISKSDQLYRTPLFYNTLDREMIAKMDSVYDNAGIEAGMKYQRSLALQMDKTVEDSLRKLQTQIDFQNHMLMRGIWERYGWIPESIISEHNSAQMALLLHPPYDIEGVKVYLEEYEALLLPEVRSGRMPATSYAAFCDNMRGKILRIPQLYGTNQVFDSKTNSILPAGIVDIDKTNQAREAIGLPPLKDGEYRIVSE